MSKKISVSIVTLGCAKNSVDSEFLLGSLNPNSFKLEHIVNVAPSDVLLINTCGFIFDAKQESINTILEAVKLKNEGLITTLIVFGCLTERYRNELEKEIPEIDYIFGVNQQKEIRKVILKGINFYGEYDNSRYTTCRVPTTPKHYAYLKISEGCNRKCSFCAIPSIRGGYVSRTIESLVEETKQLAKQGVKELILIAQDLTFYGYDIYLKPSLALLITKLSEINGIEWIRLHYAYPRFFNSELIKVIANNSKVCKYIDMPIQHISNKMLKIMNRESSKKNIINLLEKLRNNIPNVALRTTLLVGHPGETQKDFNELKQFVADFKFSRLGVFPYSHEDGTYSYLKYKDSVSQKLKTNRLSEIMQVQQEISLINNNKLINTLQNVIIDCKENENYIGRTQFDSPEIDNEVIIKDNNLKIGSFYNIKIIDATEFDLQGEIIM
ncbi:MAG: 30S ribosomal protein S12 methylthiotransferase RimO [Bacteroidetes bacterium CG_4_8_14_3_um_filter_31_14]|nr:MAG: 30S ribosomal protein S12 methylthiotransferase RimO [Bacteroidetes bacterium CG_4_8_14_3_um_filter_31_14]